MLLRREAKGEEGWAEARFQISDFKFQIISDFKFQIISGFKFQISNPRFGRLSFSLFISHFGICLNLKSEF